MTGTGNQTDHSDAISRLQRLQFEAVPNEQRELAALPGLLEGCERFIDVGANVGFYVFHANRSLHGAEIVAIEANPVLRRALEETWEHARTDSENGNRFKVESCAIWDEPGSIEFYVTRNLDDSSAFSTRIAEATKTAVPTRELDAFYQPLKKTLIKMDIEGAEYRALKSARRFLGCGHAEFFVELHPFGDAAIRKYPLQVCNLFFRNGFACKRIYHHYHFVKAGIAYRTLLYLSVFPHLFLLWLSNRYPGRLGRTVKQLHGFLAKVRRRLVP